MSNLRFNRHIFLLATVVMVLGFAEIKAQVKTKETGDSKPALEHSKSHEDCPMMAKEEKTGKDHHVQVMENGEKAMGFSQVKTTHHFLLRMAGGVIRVDANDPTDTVNRDRIRTHLAGISKQFSEGIFTTPFAVHGQIPPGAPVMDELRNDIRYKYEETPNGAQVRISTKNAKALAAIHAFIKFQIEEHQTGDSKSID